MMQRPKAVLFDLCDTLFLFDSDRLPRIVIDGREIASTAGLALQALQLDPKPPLQEFYDAFIKTSEEVGRQRESDCIEVSCEAKFQRVLHRLGLASIGPPGVRRAVAAHMAALSEALVLPDPHRELLKTLKARYRVGLITNFDHAATVHRLLDREGLGPLLDAVVISIEEGIRKPDPRIFQTCLNRLESEAQRSVYVGNDLHQDVAGARHAGIPVFWFNRHGELRRPDHPAGDRTLARLEDLKNFL